MTPITSPSPQPSPNPSSAPAPFALTGFATFLRKGLADVDLVPIQADLIDRASREPDDANILWDLSMVLQLTGNREVALQVQAQALRMQQLYRLRASAGPARMRLLAVMGPGDLMANTPIECLLDGTDVALDMLYVGPDLPMPAVVPDHDVLMVCVAENDANRPLLARLSRELKGWPRPVLNPAEAILALSRDGVCDKLQGAPGIAMPITVRIDRSVVDDLADGRCALETLLADGAFPLIIRPAGSHAGHGLEKIDRPSALASYLETRPEAEFCITRFIDYRQPDGLFRKYRIALIDGRPFLCHMGISANWMIHYANAGMAESAVKRAEEAHVMETFDEDFATRHVSAFDAIADRMGLDYLAIDCGELPDGRLLIFEVDNSMVVHAMDPVGLYPYKLPHMMHVFASFRATLASHVMHHQAQQRLTAGDDQTESDSRVASEVQAADVISHLNA